MPPRVRANEVPQAVFGLIAGARHFFHHPERATQTGGHPADERDTSHHRGQIVARGVGPFLEILEVDLADERADPATRASPHRPCCSCVLSTRPTSGNSDGAAHPPSSQAGNRESPRAAHSRTGRATAACRSIVRSRTGEFHLSCRCPGGSIAIARYWGSLSVNVAPRSMSHGCSIRLTTATS